MEEEVSHVRFVAEFALMQAPRPYRVFRCFVPIALLGGCLYLFVHRGAPIFPMIWTTGALLLYLITLPADLRRAWNPV